MSSETERPSQLIRQRLPGDLHREPPPKHQPAPKENISAFLHCWSEATWIHGHCYTPDGFGIHSSGLFLAMWTKVTTLQNTLPSCFTSFQLAVVFLCFSHWSWQANYNFLKQNKPKDPKHTHHSLQEMCHYLSIGIPHAAVRDFFFFFQNRYSQHQKLIRITFIIARALCSQNNIIRYGVYKLQKPKFSEKRMQIV